jgi:hypothetical protein
MGGPWTVQALSFMEQGTLAEGLSRLSENTSVTPTPWVESLVRATVNTFHCPTRRDADAYPLVEPYASHYGERGARTDYAMNGGPATIETDDDRVIHTQYDGVWVLGKRVKFNRIFDGLSYTYLLGEKAMDSLKYVTGDCFGDRSPLAGFSESHVSTHSYVRYASRPPKIDSVNNCLVCHDFGSAHPAGWNVAMSDGSVRLMNFELDIDVHRANASVDGREVPEYRH